jgi:hypothetical protein
MNTNESEPIRRFPQGFFNALVTFQCEIGHIVIVFLHGMNTNTAVIREAVRLEVPVQQILPGS